MRVLEGRRAAAAGLDEEQPHDRRVCARRVDVRPTRSRCDARSALLPHAHRDVRREVQRDAAELQLCRASHGHVPYAARQAAGHVPAGSLVTPCRRHRLEPSRSRRSYLPLFHG